MPINTDTLTRAEIAEAIYRRVGMSRAEALIFVESILEHVALAMGRGENVKIAGFGTFRLSDKNERIGRNPKTGKEVPVTARRVVTFKASEMLKQRIVSGDVQS